MVKSSDKEQRVASQATNGRLDSSDVDRSAGGNQSLPEAQLLFIAFCIEMFARRHGIGGQEALAKFDSCGVCEFLSDYYDPLHSQDREAILDDIELLMKGNANHANA